MVWGPQESNNGMIVFMYCTVYALIFSGIVLRIKHSTKQLLGEHGDAVG
jgi:hypothetical protein